MECDEITPKLRVRTSVLQGTAGMSVSEKHLACRRTGLTGEVLGYVPGHGGDVWFVQHDGSEDIGAYCFIELEKAFPSAAEA